MKLILNFAIVHKVTMKSSIKPGYVYICLVFHVYHNLHTPTDPDFPIYILQDILYDIDLHLAKLAALTQSIIR